MPFSPLGTLSALRSAIRLSQAPGPAPHQLSKDLGESLTFSGSHISSCVGQRGKSR